MTPILRRKNSSRAFTLVELIIVIFIILILAVALIIAIQIGISRSKSGDTQRLMTDLTTAMSKYVDVNGEGRFPGADIDPEQDFSTFREGNQALLAALEPYLDQNTLRDFVGFWDATTKTVKDTGTTDQRVLIDGHKHPIVYWEWASARNKSSVSFDRGRTGGATSTGRDLKSWGPKDQDFSIWSAGPDGDWGSPDDINGSGESQKSPVTGSFRDN